MILFIRIPLGADNNNKHLFFYNFNPYNSKITTDLKKIQKNNKKCVYIFAISTAYKFMRNNTHSHKHVCTHTHTHSYFSLIVLMGYGETLIEDIPRSEFKTQPLS